MGLRFNERYLSQKSPLIVLGVSIQKEPSPHQALLLYDGECTFCCCSAAVLARVAEDEVRVLPVQGGSGIRHGISAGTRLRAVTLIEGNGKTFTGAAAIFRFMSIYGSRVGELLWWLYRKVGLFRSFAEWGYRLIAQVRHVFPHSDR